MQDVNVIRKVVNSVITKLVIIGVLVAVLLIPVEMIKEIISDRSLGKQKAIEEVSQKWGQAQSIAGPFLSIPYRTYSINEKGVESVSIQYAHFLPEELTVQGLIQPDIRYRGIYEIILYSGELQLSAVFHKIRLHELGIAEKDVIWEQAFVSVGISDLKGLKNNNTVTWDQSNYLLNSGIEAPAFMDSGVSARVPVSGNQEKYSFNMNLNINGSGQLAFYPLGKVTTIQLSSAWTSPSFTGAFLPDERVVNDRGFEAKWKILHLNRNYPQQWIGKNTKISESAFGTKLFYPVNEYQKSMRSVKYAILFIVLTFISFFLTEVMNKNKLHPIQYLLVGFAICIFYTLLISISEHAKFWIAYGISSVASILLVTLYSKSILKSLRLALMVGSLLLFLYAFLYVTLQLEDYALLMGSVGLLIALGLVMYVTRKTDWYAFAHISTDRHSAGGNGHEQIAL